MSTDMTSAAPMRPAHAPAQPPSIIRTIFLGPNGIRAGWRLLLFILFFLGIGRAVNFGLHHVPGFAEWAKTQSGGTITAAFQIVTEGLTLFALFLVVWIMSKIEKRSFTDYGLPMNEAFGKRFWQGIPFGFLALSLLLAVIAVLHGFSLGGAEIGGAQAVKYAALFSVVFILVGMFEEFLFRGYLQATLGSGIGFWPAAILLSILFGAGHLGNPGEAKIGAVMAGSFGLVAAFSLWRTGNLWFPIGMHAAWDWGETYFYGVPDSGLLATGRLFNSSSHGPQWLTGGSVGPEGSYLVFPVLILICVAVYFAFPERRRTA
jgi:membrane protease YdiL (CAAX protease family)